MEKATVKRNWHQMLESLRSALASESKLSETMSQVHSEAVIRAYLTKVSIALESKLSS